MPETPSPKPGAGGRDGLRCKAHPEPLPSLDHRSDPQAFHHIPAQRPGLTLHYQCRDYAPLQSRPPGLSSLIAAGSRSHSVPPHRAYSSERRTTAVRSPAAGRGCSSQGLVTRKQRTPGASSPSPAWRDRHTGLGDPCGRATECPPPAGAHGRGPRRTEPPP